MRRAIRIQPYLSRDLSDKLRAYAAARSLTVSAVVADALNEYLERDQADDALVVRRLDGVMHAVEQLGRGLDALAVGFGRYVRYSFLSAPAGADDKVVKRAEALYRQFLGKVGEQLRAGGTFTHQVFPTRLSRGMPAGPTDGEAGDRDEGGES